MQLAVLVVGGDVLVEGVGAENFKYCLCAADKVGFEPETFCQNSVFQEHIYFRTPLQRFLVLDEMRVKCNVAWKLRNVVKKVFE